MIIYNVTCKVDASIHDEWLEWMNEKHIQDVLETGFFTAARISQLLGQDDNDGPTYSIQYEAPSMKDLHLYRVQAAPKLQQEHIDKFGEKVLAYRTMMELIRSHKPA